MLKKEIYDIVENKIINMLEKNEEEIYIENIIDP
jgi:hypothetical protein